MKQTLYDILEVSRDASFEDIEVAYAKRFEKLKGETSWDSNRLVMLNEAREVLSDASRRAAYDASLEASAQQPEARILSEEFGDSPRSSGKWIVAGLIVLAIVIWWSMRDDAPPVDSNGLQAPGEQVAADPAAEEITVTLPGIDNVADVGDDETLDEPDAFDFEEDAEPEVNELSAPAAAAGTGAGQSTVASIVGFWDCFEPVTGRTSEYGFTADGTLTIQRPGGEPQSLAYEMTGRRLDFVDADLPGTMEIEELAARRLVLGSSNTGQRLVCSR